MRFSPGLPLRISSVVFLVACYEQAVSGNQIRPVNGDDYDYEEDYYDNEDEAKEFHRGATGGPEIQQSSLNTHAIPCYSCHFIFQHDHQQGLVNCRDPFTPTDIPVVTCRGACAKVYRKLEGKSDFDIARNCMPNCKEIRTEKDNIDCCTTELCNGFMAATSLNNRIRTLAMAVIAVVLLFLLLR